MGKRSEAQIKQDEKKFFFDISRNAKKNLDTIYEELWFFTTENMANNEVA